MPSIFRIGVVVCLVTACAVAPASAQVTGSSRPYRALFGGSSVDPDVRHSLDVTASVLGAYDDNVLADAGGGLVSPGSAFQQSGFYSEFAGTLSYAWAGRRVQVGANLGTNARYYHKESEFIGVAHSAGVGVAAEFARRTTLFLNQSVSYSAAYMYGMFPGLGVAIPGEVVGVGPPLTDQQVLVYDTSARLSHGLTSRGSMELIAGTRYSDFGASEALLQDLRSYEVGGRYRHGLTRHASLRLGYVYREGAYGFTATSGPSVVHDIEAGVDYARALSFSRRTTLGFGVGSSLVRSPLETSGQSELQYRVVGDVNLTHEIGRTWRARAAYNRGVGFAEAFAQPVFSDAVNASVTGFFNRRTDFVANAAVSIGDVGLRSAQSSFRLYTASTRVRFALASMWAIFVEHQYYKQDVGNALIVPQGVPSNIDRHTVRAGLTLWVPIVRK